MHNKKLKKKNNKLTASKTQTPTGLPKLSLTEAGESVDQSSLISDLFNNAGIGISIAKRIIADLTTLSGNERIEALHNHGLSMKQIQKAINTKEKFDKRNNVVAESLIMRIDRLVKAFITT